MWQWLMNNHSSSHTPCPPITVQRGTVDPILFQEDLQDHIPHCIGQIPFGFNFLFGCECIMDPLCQGLIADWLCDGGGARLSSRSNEGRWPFEVLFALLLFMPIVLFGPGPQHKPEPFCDE